MKKLKSILMVGMMLLSTLFLTACGEVTITFNTNGGTQVENLVIGKDETEKIEEAIEGIAKSGYEIVGVYYDSAFTDHWSLDDKIEKDTTLYIKWRGKEYNLSFNANGGTGVMQNSVVRYTESLENLPNCIFTKTGYSFDEWNTKADGSGTSYANEAQFVMNEQGMALYAIWEVNEYSVIFNANGGTGLMDDLAIDYLSSAQLTECNLTKYGHNFAGWNTKADGTGTSYADKASYTMNSLGETLFAQWTKQTHNVTFNANTGTGTAMTALPVRYSENAVVPACSYTKVGYTFDGWNTKADGTGTNYAVDASITMDIQDIELFAKWKANKYNVVFDANTGAGEMASLEITFDTSKNLTANVFTKTGYYFTGWNTKADGKGTAYAENAEFNMNVLGQTLYAQWTIEKYNVVFKNEQTTLLTLNDVAYGTNFNEATGFVETALSVINSPATGFVYGGFFTADDEFYENRYDVNSTMPDNGQNGSTLTIYLYWATQTSNVAIDYNEATEGNTQETIEVVYGEAIGTLPTPSKTDYTFIGWYKSETSFTNVTLVTAETVWTDNFSTIYAKWIDSDEQFTIQYELDGGTFTATQPQSFTCAAEVTLPQITKTGYTFAKWTLSADATLNGLLVTAGSELTKKETAYVIPAKSFGNIELTAVWTANDYDVVFDANTGSGSMDNLEITFDTAKTLIKNAFTKVGYYFSGWNTSANGAGTSYDDESEFTMNVTGDTLYAQWTKESYNVLLKSGDDEMITLNNILFGEAFNTATNYTSNAITEVYATYAPTGKVFEGYYKADDTTLSNRYDLNSLMADIGENNDTLTLYINWKWIEANLDFNYDGATAGNTETSIAVTYGIAIGTLPTPTKTNYTFIGWYSSNTEWTTSTLVTADTIWENNFTELYAKWVSTNEHQSIIYDLKNGFFSGENPGVYYLTSVEKSINDAHMEGHTFKGWKLTKDAYLNGVLVSAGTLLPKYTGGKHYIPIHSFGKIEIEATWEIQTHTVTYKVRNANDTDWEVLGTLTADYATDVTLLTDYSVAKYITELQKTNFAFDGWYTSYTTFTELTKFNNKISYVDIIVYPHYIAKLAAPTNISVLQESTKVTWDAVEGAEYYEVSIDGAAAQIADTNSFETGLVLSIADSYEIKVRAMSEYTGLNGENINSDYSTYNFTRLVSLQNAILKIRDQEDVLVKYVMFTDNIYTWNSDKYQVSITELSSPDVADVEVTSLAGVYTSRLTIGNKAGSFTFAIDYFDEARQDATYRAQIVEDVDTVAYGEAYKQYLTSVNASMTKYLNKQNPTAYLVGTANAVKFDFELKNGNKVFSDYNILDEELLTYKFEIKENETYRDATTTELPTKVTEDNIGAESNDEIGMFKFDSANIGKEYRVTVSCTYTKFGTTQNPLGTISNTFEFKLNGGYNAFTHEQLKQYYGDSSIHEVNILRNITPVLSEDQTQADGSPINVGSGRVFDNDDTESDNATVALTRKTDGNVYKRAYKNIFDDRITVNGNYCTIDASKLPLVNAEYSAGTGSSNNGVNSQVGYMSPKSTNFTLLRPHLGVFRYQSPFGGEATYNNLEILCNKPTGPITTIVTDAQGKTLYNEDGTPQTRVVSATDPEYKTLYEERAMKESASYSAFYFETSKAFTNNVIIKNSHHAIRVDGAMKKFVEGKDSRDRNNWVVDEISNPVRSVPNNGMVEANYLSITDTYSTGIYSWEGKSIKMYNCYATNCNGPVAQIDNESTPTNGIFVLDKHSVLENYLTGSESWFTLWQQASLATALKSLLEPVLNSMGASVLRTLESGADASNLIYVSRPCSSVSAAILEDGTRVANAANASVFTTYFGGEKAVISGETLSTGVATTRTLAHFANSDMRVSGGLHAFGITPAVTTDQFNAAAAAIQTVLTNSTLQSLAVAYSLGNTAVWQTASQTAIAAAGNAPLSALISEEVFGLIGNNVWEYGVARKAVLDAEFAGTKILSMDKPMYTQAYDTVANAIASSLSISADMVKSKLTLDHFNELYDMNASTGKVLFSFDTLQTAAYTKALTEEKTQQQATTAAGQAVVSFLLLKLCDALNLNTQAIEVCMPVNNANGLQLVYAGYGFIDQEGWNYAN